MRKPIVAGNWKMNGTLSEAVELAGEVRRRLGESTQVETVLCPPFTVLGAVGELLRDSAVGLGAQNVYWAESGAYTGEVSPRMLADLGCSHVIVGHSERRTLFAETDDAVRRKTVAVLEAGMTPIICVGETLEQRESGRTEHVVATQVREGLRESGAELERVVIAYEPVWAIGTGRTAEAQEVQAVHAFIRGLLGELGGVESAARVRIQYGGSVKPSNSRALFGQQDVDGGLIGGAALNADSFVEIVNSAC